MSISAHVTDFGTIPCDRDSSPVTVRLTNTGVNTIVVSSIILTGTNAEEFKIIPDSSTPNSLTPALEPSTSCYLQITAIPATAGSKNANLNVTTVDGSVDLSFTATAYRTIQGTVRDQATDLAVSGVTVITNTGTTATTTFDGSYNLGYLPTATYSLSATKTGYQNTTLYNLIVTATTSAKANILLPTVGPLNITSNSLPWASPTVAYSSRVKVAGGIAPYTISKAYGTLPTGLILDASTGIISGTPTGTGSYTFAIGVTDTVSGYVEKEFTIELLPPLQITTLILSTGVQGISYSSSVLATGGKPAYSFTLVGGSLPKGLTLSTNGSLSGTPREYGAFNISVRVTDAAGITVDKSYSLTLSPAATLTLNTLTLPQGYLGTSYSTTLSASGGVPSRTYSVTGTLPTGLSLKSSTGVISGTPSAAGLTNLTFTVTDY